MLIPEVEERIQQPALLIPGLWIVVSFTLVISRRMRAILISSPGIWGSTVTSTSFSIGLTSFLSVPHRPVWDASSKAHCRDLKVHLDGKLLDFTIAMFPQQFANCMLCWREGARYHAYARKSQ